MTDGRSRLLPYVAQNAFLVTSNQSHGKFSATSGGSFTFFGTGGYLLPSPEVPTSYRLLYGNIRLRQLLIRMGS